MKNLSFKWKLSLAVMFVSIVPMTILTWYNYNKGSGFLEQNAVSKLSAISSNKKARVNSYFNSIAKQVKTLSHDVMITSAMEEFSSAYNNFPTEESGIDESVLNKSLNNFYQNEFNAKYKKENKKEFAVKSTVNSLSLKSKIFQYNFITNNSNPLGEKDALASLNDGSLYSQIHSKYHPSIREFLQEFGYYDIFLVDINSGDIVYSVFKELDYATSLKTGPYSNTNFAKTFEMAKEINNKDDFAFVDFENYAPSYEAPASFIASPIWKNGKKIGVLIFQMPIDTINSVMSEKSGLGQTGESFIVGSDKLMRSDSFYQKKTHSVVNSFKNQESGAVNSKSVELAVAKKEGSIVETDYMGHETLTTYAPFNVLGKFNWAIISKINTEEAFQGNRDLLRMNLIVFAIALIVIVLITQLLANYIHKVISGISVNLKSSTEKLNASSEQLNTSSGSLSTSCTSQAASLQQAVVSIDEIKSMVKRNSESAVNSTKVSKKSTEVAVNGQKKVDELKTSIEEIASDSSNVLSHVDKMSQDVSQIVSLISEIDNKTKIINDIVFQTKLLSFNASVEAARAGEQGKGFAVVAEEVGNLAKMSGTAAEEISQLLIKSTTQVEELVSSTQEKSKELTASSKLKIDSGIMLADECSEVLSNIVDNSENVSKLVNEITIATSEQSRGISEVSNMMSDLDSLTHQNTNISQSCSKMSNDLKSESENLDHAVSDLIGFLTGEDLYKEKLDKDRQKNDENSGKSFEDLKIVS